MHDKENDNCVRESCTQYVILRVLHPPWQIYMTSDKTRTIVWKLFVAIGFGASAPPQLLSPAANSLSIRIARRQPQPRYLAQLPIACRSGIPVGVSLSLGI